MMFCPTCGAPNPDGSRFCNQCGATLSATGATSTAQGGVTRVPTDHGTGDRIELPMVGPSKRTIIAMMLGVGLGCLGLGALAAWRTLGQSSAQPPITPVGLFGEPTSVTSAEPVSDGGVPAAPSSPEAPSRPTRAARPTGAPTPTRPTTVASNAHPTPSGSTPTTPTANTPTGTPEPAEPGEPATPTGATAPTTPTPTGADPTPTTPTGPTTPTTAATPLPAEPGGVRERVPGTPAGSGFRLGEETDATGHMDPAAFRFVYDHYRSQIASCYSNATRNDTPVSGVIVMRVRIGEDGHVRNTRVISDSAHTPALTRCVQTSVQSWRYPRPEGGEVEVDYPMRFGSSR
jgi:hypothetical protein